MLGTCWNVLPPGRRASSLAMLSPSGVRVGLRFGDERRKLELGLRMWLILLGVKIEVMAFRVLWYSLKYSSRVVLASALLAKPSRSTI